MRGVAALVVRPEIMAWYCSMWERYSKAALYIRSPIASLWEFLPLILLLDARPYTHNDRHQHDSHPTHEPHYAWPIGNNPIKIETSWRKKLAVDKNGNENYS